MLNCWLHAQGKGLKAQAAAEGGREGSRQLAAGSRAGEGEVLKPNVGRQVKAKA